MANFNRTSGELQVHQSLLGVLQKLIEAGSPPETISIATGIDIEEIRKLLANHPKQLAKLVETIQEKSRRFRCAQSNRLMVSPVLAADENYYEESILQAHPDLSSKQVMRHSKFKEEIAEFSRDSLKALESYLHQKEAQEDALQLTAECLSVLSLEADLERVLKILGAVEGKKVRVLTEKLRDLVSVEYLLSLMSQTVRQLPYQALCLAKLVILHSLSEGTSEEAFSCFTEQLSQTPLSQAVVELVDEISERLSSSQLGRLNSVLERQPREEGLEDKLEALKLKEAYLRLREGDIETAASIVSTLHNIPYLEEEVLKFYEDAGMPSAKLTILKHRLSASLEALRPESPAVAATISIVCQVFDTELLTLKTESASQESFASLKAETGVVYGTVTEARKEAASRMQRLEDQSERRNIASQECLKTLKGELEKLKLELAETQRILQLTTTSEDNLVEVKIEPRQFSYYEAHDVLRIEELRLKATQETEVSCPCCNFKNVIERDATSLSCCYCRKKCCILCNKESSEFHDCQIQPDTQCPACGRLADRNQCKYFYCNYCATWGCRLCLGVLRDLGTHFTDASGCINQRNSSVDTTPKAEEVKTTSAIINADFTCRCQTPIFIALQSCSHLICKKCFAENIKSEVQGRDLSAVMMQCPWCSDTLSSDELASLVSQEEFKDNAVLGHVPTTAQTKTEFSPTVLESLARTEADKQTKLCPKCSFSKKKFGTANIQLCSQCGTDFCWLCEQVIIHRQRKVHFDPSNSYCVGLQARVAREERTSKPSNCTCGSPVELILSCGHRSCKDCLLSSALTTSDPSQVKCLTCYAVVPQELLRSLKEEQRKTTAHLRGSNPALPPNPYSKPCPCCQQPCSNPLNKLTVRCSCIKEFCWTCWTPFTLTTKQSDHFVKINGDMKCKFWYKGT